MEILENLESRIAPAIYNAGGVSGIDYNDAPFVATDSGSADTTIATLFSASSDHYYLPLLKGDILKIFNSTSGYETFLEVSAGEVLAYFYDSNSDFIVDANELSGISLTAKATFSSSGSVDGDIIANYNGAQFLSALLAAPVHGINADNLISDTQSISGITIAGSVAGRVVAGGSISNVSIVGSVEQINTGSAGIGYGYDFGGTGAGAGIGEDTIAFYYTNDPLSATPAIKKAGPSISNVKVGSLDDPNDLPNGYGSIIASNGGDGAIGGSLINITVIGDDSGFNLSAGNGGMGTATIVKAGAGGKISGVYVQGISDNTGPNDQITITSGTGGDGFNSDKGVGGAGGLMEKVYVGYQQNGKSVDRSPELLFDNVSITAGDGGQGKVGGIGGSVNTVKIATSTPDQLLVDELEVHAGNGGDAYNFAKAVGGLGGSILNSEVRNFNDVATAATIVIGAGDGGLINLAGGNGGSGGYLSKVTLLGFNATLNGGIGQDGTAKSGNGGYINTVAVENIGSIVAQQLSLIAGAGGNGTVVSGGIGGYVANLTMGTVDFDGTGLVVTAGNGGNSTSLFGKGKGGIGGYILNANITDNIASGNSATTTFTSGDGGDGVSGGAGGYVSKITLVGDGVSAVLSAGDGGNAIVTGAGGNGGLISYIGIGVEGLNTTITTTAGLGGNAGGKGKGGSGGAILNLNLSAPGDVSVAGGNGGGTGVGGTTGIGGSITKVGISASELLSSASIIAGNAGNPANAVKGAVGGSITDLNTAANLDITINAGNGSAGGAGGSITRAVFSSSLVGSPSGDVEVLAGDGSALIAGKSGGNGGSLTTITGFSSSTPGNTTLIQAGDGGTAANLVKGANGGNINGLNLLDGTDDGQVTIWAGEGSDGSTGVGGNGGSITGVNIGQDVLVANLLAGDGGNSLSGKGGLGGSISKIVSYGDIGYRTGKNFGFDGSVPANYYNQMGGIFAGVGGTGSVVGKSGSVLSVTANAISSIVAGKELASPALVYNVDNIYLNFDGLDNNPTVSGTSYTNWATANMVGGIAGSPAAAGATTFKLAGNVPWPALSPAGTWVVGTTQPWDGLIAAITLGSNRNFIPMAFLSLNSFGQTTFAGQRVPV